VGYAGGANEETPPFGEALHPVEGEPITSFQEE